VVAGSKVIAMTTLDLMLNAKLLKDAKDYFSNVQTRDQKYVAFLSASDKPPIERNADIMNLYRERLRQYYYEPTKYKTYLEQLGIAFPTLEKPAAAQ
jgi:aminobenzoyl-glutamate utilization protein B